MLDWVLRHRTAVQVLLAIAAGVTAFGAVAGTTETRENLRWWKLSVMRMVVTYDGCGCPDCEAHYLLGERIWLSSRPSSGFICGTGRRSQAEMQSFSAVVSVGCVFGVFGMPRLAEYRRRERLKLAGCCGGCGYNLAGLAGGRCPECGQRTWGGEGPV